MIVDRSLLPLLEQFRERTQIEHVFVVEDSYEDLLAGRVRRRLGRARPRRERGRSDVLHERHDRPARRASSTRTARSVLHALGVAANHPLGLSTSVHDTILPVVPMFHANAWGYPYVATMLGAKLVYPGPHLDAESLLEDFVAGEGHLVGRRPDDLARRCCTRSTRARASGICRT